MSTLMIDYARDLVHKQMWEADFLTYEDSYVWRRVGRILWDIPL